MRDITKAGLAAVSLAAGLTLTACNPGDSDSKAAPTTATTATTTSAATSTPADSPAAQSGVKSNSGSNSGSGSGSNSGSSAGKPKSSGLPACTQGQLAISNSAGAGPLEHILTFNLRNTSSTTCTMHGYPGVDVIGADMDEGGKQMQVSVPRGDYSSSVEMLTLAPGDYGQFGISYTPASNSSLEFDPKTLVMTPPNTRESLTFPLNVGYKVTFSWDNVNNKLSGESLHPIVMGPGQVS